MLSEQVNTILGMGVLGFVVGIGCSVYIYGCYGCMRRLGFLQAAITRTPDPAVQSPTLVLMSRERAQRKV